MINEKQFLRKILYNPFLREKFKNFEKNKKYFGYYSKEEYVLKLQDLILEEISKMNKSIFDIELIISWFKNILQDYYFEDVYLLLYSQLNIKLIDKSKELDVEIEPYTTYVSSLLSRDEYIRKYETCIEKYLNYSKKYMIDDEFEKYVFAVNSQKEIDEQTFGLIFNMLLDKKYKISVNEYREFFLKFSLFAMKEFGLQHNSVSFSKKIRDVAVYKLDKEGKQRNKITFNQEKINPNNILENLMALFHEIKHGVQFQEMNSLYRIDSIKQLEDAILKKVLGEQFYNVNYNVISYETDAVICSQILLSYFLKSYAPLTYRKEKDKINEAIDSLTEKEQNNTRKIYDQNSDLQILFSTILINNSEILNANLLTPKERAVLLQIYNEDCTPKTPDYYFREKERLLVELNSCIIGDEIKVKEIKQKIDFYDAILNSFEYSIDNLKKNYIALDNYKSDNQDIMAEVWQYKNKIIDQLLNYGESKQISVPQERVIK